MKASELIKELEYSIKVHSDLNVEVLDFYCGWVDRVQIVVCPSEPFVFKIASCHPQDEDSKQP